MILSLRRWLAQPVIEDFGTDRPFRLRRVSLLLMLAGWMTFLLSCLVGLWLVGRHVPIAGWAGLVRGHEPAVYAGVQWAKAMLEAVGAATFVAGMFSVTFFDRRDRIPVWKAD